MIVSYQTGQTFLSAQDEIRFLRQRIDAQNAEFQRLTKRPLASATVIAVDGSKCNIAVGNQIMEVETPRSFEVTPATRVHIDPNTHAIIDVIKEPFLMGISSVIDRVIDDKHAITNAPGMGSKVIIFHGKSPKPGDSVVLDPCGMIVVRNLGQSAVKGPIYETGVSWDDIRGQDDEVRTMRGAIEGPIVDKALRARYGKKSAKGALLAGPAGCGKTLLAAACATALAKIHGRESTASGYQYVKGPEVLNHMLGESEANVRRIFANARAHFAEHGYPCVVFLDEGDALLGRRDRSTLQTMNGTIVPMFLTEMDGLEASCAFVILATNRPDMLDPAVTRDGRLDLKVQVGRPDRDGMVSIFDRHLRGVPLDGFSSTKAAEQATDELTSSRHVLYMLRSKSGKTDARFLLSDVASGAMCAGLVARAIDVAIERVKASGEETGVRPCDLAAAADRLCAEQRMLDHTPELTEMAQAIGQDFKAVERAKA